MSIKDTLAKLDDAVLTELLDNAQFALNEIATAKEEGCQGIWNTTGPCLGLGIPRGAVIHGARSSAGYYNDVPGICASDRTG